MLKSYVNSLLDNATAHLLIYNDTNGTWVNIEDSACSSMVEFIGHTFMNGSIDNNVNVVSDFVVGEASGDVDAAFLSESFAKFMSSFSSVSVAVGHVTNNINMWT